MRDELLTLQEVSQLLRVNRATIYRMARSSKIPASKVGRQWRFERKLITHWLRQQRNTEKVASK